MAGGGFLARAFAELAKGLDNWTAGKSFNDDHYTERPKPTGPQPRDRATGQYKARPKRDASGARKPGATSAKGSKDVCAQCGTDLSGPDVGMAGKVDIAGLSDDDVVCQPCAADAVIGMPKLEEPKL